MEIPIYYSFAEFQQNYESNFMQWQNEYPEGTDKDFRWELFHYYQGKFLTYTSEFDKFYFSNLWEVTEKGELYDVKKQLRINTVTNIIAVRFNEYCSTKEIVIDSEKDYLEKIAETPEIFGWSNSDKYKIDYNQFLHFAYFLDVEKSKDKFQLFLSDQRVKNFEYTLKKIENFAEGSTDETTIDEVDYSGDRELSTKQKLILMDKLGIINLLIDQLKIKENASHLAEIISAITGIDNKKGTLTSYCNYLIRPDNNHHNSPYNSKANVSKALQIFKDFEINAN